MLAVISFKHQSQCIINHADQVQKQVNMFGGLLMSLSQEALAGVEELYLQTI